MLIMRTEPSTCSTAISSQRIRAPLSAATRFPTGNTMFWNNVKIALRNLRKNKVFALVNILGLALGLTIYVFGGLLVKYESTHDMFFENAANIYTIGSIAAPDLDVGIDRFNATFTTVGPIIEAELQ